MIACVDILAISGAAALTARFASSNRPFESADMGAIRWECSERVTGE